MTLPEADRSWSADFAASLSGSACAQSADPALQYRREASSGKEPYLTQIND
jgi:hypothetical protein